MATIRVCNLVAKVLPTSGEHTPILEVLLLHTLLLGVRVLHVLLLHTLLLRGLVLHVLLLRVLLS